MKDSERNGLTGSTSVMERRKENFEPMKEKNENRVKEVGRQDLAKINKSEVWKELNRMKRAKAADPDNTHVEVRKYLEEVVVEFLTGHFNKIMESENAWRRDLSGTMSRGGEGLYVLRVHSLVHESTQKAVTSDSKFTSQLVFYVSAE